MRLISMTISLSPTLALGSTAGAAETASLFPARLT